jgi:hypothetical protein
MWITCQFPWLVNVMGHHSGLKALSSARHHRHGRRADTIERYLTDEFGIDGTDLVTVGYGKTKPKDLNALMDPINRRVQVVNMDTRNASK